MGEGASPAGDDDALLRRELRRELRRILHFAPRNTFLMPDMTMFS